MVCIRINKHLAVVRSYKRGISKNMAHHFNGENCSINNLVWAPVAKVDDELSMREAEAELKKIETLDQKDVLHATMGHELPRNKRNC